MLHLVCVSWNLLIHKCALVGKHNARQKHEQKIYVFFLQALFLLGFKDKLSLYYILIILMALLIFVGWGVYMLKQLTIEKY